jgi:exodeoxyribonuclease V alpha subunit
VLLGDRDQLSSVEPGAVFAGLCAGLPADNVVVLERSHRFPAGSGIGRLARSVRAGDAEAAIAVLESGAADLSWKPAPDPQRAVDLAMAGFAPLFEAVEAGADPVQCFAALDRFRVLCASRVGPLGAHAINRGVIARLQAQGRVPAQSRALGGGRGGHFVGQPLMVTRNDYSLRLFNGDVGVVVPDADDRLAVAFPVEDGGYRSVALARLPDCETVYAMTVHKSQGSEFDAALVLPAADRPGLATRELVYTAVTRVRRHAALLCGRDALAEAIRARAERDSGLEDRLSAA